MNGTVYSSPPVSAGDTFQDQPRIVANPIQVNFRSTKVDAGKLKREYLNRPWSTLAVKVLINNNWILLLTTTATAAAAVTTTTTTISTTAAGAATSF